LKIATVYIEVHLIRENNGKIEFLLLKRASYEKFPDIWQMVSGKIKSDETAIEATLREIKEETNLIPEKLWVLPRVNSFYLAEDDSINLVPVFVAKVDNKSIVKISDEHSEFSWVDGKEAKRLLAWSGQRTSIDLISEYFDYSKRSFLYLTEINL